MDKGLRKKVALLAVDECHCVTEWYGQLSSFLGVSIIGRTMQRCRNLDLFPFFLS